MMDQTTTLGADRLPQSSFVFSRIKDNIAENLPLWTFSVFYFLTTVLVNILYAIGIGREWPANFVPNFSWSHFTVSFGPLYWILLLCPFVVLPLVAIPTAKTAGPVANRLASLLTEFQKLPFAILCILLYGYVAFELWRGGAVAKLFSAGDAMDQVRARFALQAEIGFPTQVALLALLQFFAIYACVKAMRQKDLFWRLAAIIHVVAMLAFLVLLNMKWPVILFIITLGVVVFVTAKRAVIISTIAVMICAAAVYLLISAALLKMEPSPTAVAATMVPSPVLHVPPPVAANPAAPHSLAHSPPAVSTPKPPSPSAAPSVAPPSFGEDAIRLISAAKDNVGMLTVVLLNRMGDEVPFYYDTFTTKGAFCGTFFDWFFHTPGLKCRPSLYIYTEMFHDDFAGEGTSPAAFQIYEYSREGWAGVAVALLLGGLFFGAFMALRPTAEKSDIVAAIFVMGAPAAYALSQLPIEGAIIYANGIAWWGAVVVLNALVAAAYRRRHA